MKNYSDEPARSRNAVAIGIWENEGGAPGSDPMDHQYGRPIETDRPWTVYPVFTGVSAPVGGDAMIGPSRMDATDGMISINLRNIGRREERLSLGINACEIAADRS